MYRWKHFEPSASYSLRALLFHDGLFQSFLAAGASFSGNNEDVASIEALIQAAVLDEDDADGNPGLRQQVRLGKTLKFFRSGEAKAPHQQNVTWWWQLGNRSIHQSKQCRGSASLCSRLYRL